MSRYRQVTDSNLRTPSHADSVCCWGFYNVANISHQLQEDNTSSESCDFQRDLGLRDSVEAFQASSCQASAFFIGCHLIGGRQEDEFFEGKFRQWIVQGCRLLRNWGQWMDTQTTNVKRHNWFVFSEVLTAKIVLLLWNHYIVKLIPIKQCWPVR